MWGLGGDYVHPPLGGRAVSWRAYRGTALKSPCQLRGRPGLLRPLTRLRPLTARKRKPLPSGRGRAAHLNAHAAACQGVRLGECGLSEYPEGSSLLWPGRMSHRRHNIGPVSIRERLYPAQEDLAVLHMHCAHARYVWNLGLEQRGYWRRGMPSISAHAQQRSLAQARKDTWLGEGSSSVQQQALFDLDRAFKNFWRNPSHFGRPSWRKAGIHEGFAVRDLKTRRINRRWGEVHVPKLGWVRFRITRAWAEIAGGTSARVTLDRAQRWHVSFTTPPKPFERTGTGAVVGLDMGVVSAFTTSDGEHSVMPQLLSPGETQRKRRLERKLARQQKGSKRRERTKHQIARLAAKEADWVIPSFWRTIPITLEKRDAISGETQR